MKDKAFSLKKIDVTQKEIIQFLVLKQVQGSPAHLAEIHRSISEGIKEDDLSPNRSRTYVYKTIKEMDEQGWISHHQEGRKKIFSLCHTGRMVLDDFRERYIPLLTSIEKAVKQMILNVTSKEFHDVPWTLSEEEKRYLSKILNVKSFIRWYILHQLLEKKERHAGELYREMRRWYAWINSHGYFYQVIREMDSEGWITSRWLNEDTRSKRNYEISKVGKEKYNELTESIRLHLEGIHQFLRSMIQQFDHVS